MQKRIIEYFLTSENINPASVQSGGIQGEHNATELLFDVSQLDLSLPMSKTLSIRADITDGVGGFYSSEPLFVTDGKVSYILPYAVTKAGGTAQLYLVFTALSDNSEQPEEQIMYSYPAMLSFKPSSAGIPAKAEFRGELSGLLLAAQGARLGAEEAYSKTNSAVTWHSSDSAAHLDIRDDIAQVAETTMGHINNAAAHITSKDVKAVVDDTLIAVNKSINDTKFFTMLPTTKPMLDTPSEFSSFLMRYLKVPAGQFGVNNHIYNYPEVVLDGAYDVIPIYTGRYYGYIDLSGDNPEYKITETGASMPDNCLWEALADGGYWITSELKDLSPSLIKDATGKIASQSTPMLSEQIESLYVPADSTRFSSSEWLENGDIVELMPKIGQPMPSCFSVINRPDIPGLHGRAFYRLMDVDRNDNTFALTELNSTTPIIGTFGECNLLRLQGIMGMIGIESALSKGLASFSLITDGYLAVHSNASDLCPYINTYDMNWSTYDSENTNTVKGELVKEFGVVNSSANYIKLKLDLKFTKIADRRYVISGNALVIAFNNSLSMLGSRLYEFNAMSTQKTSNVKSLNQIIMGLGTQYPSYTGLVSDVKITLIGG